MKMVLTSLRWALGAMLIGLSIRSALAAGGVLREARITQVIKDVKLLPAQAAPRPASVSDTLRGDTAVRTGAESRAELTFGDLTIARLGANTIFSFNEGTRTVDLASGAILLRVPKDSGGAKIQTAAVTAAITGTTVIAEYHPPTHAQPNSYAKYLVLEGQMRLYLKGRLGESVLMGPGQMMILNPNATRLSEVVDFDLERLLRTSLFFQDFRPLRSEPLMVDAQHVQLEKKAAGELLETNLVIFGRGTLVTMTDPQSLDVIDRKTAAVTLPTPTPTATPTATPIPTPTPTPSPIPTPTPTPTPIPTPTPTPTPVPTPTPTPSPVPSPTPSPTPNPSPTPTPTPNKFGTPPPITSFVPYPIDNGTVIQTDPTITRAGVTDLGKIYRDATQDGLFSTWAFTATSPFDTTAGIDALYGPNVPVAAFKFTALQLVGNPTISTANGGARNLALISVGPITSASSGNTTFTFTGLQSVLIATQLGSIDISGPDIVFQGIPSLSFYARGTGSNLTLGGMGIFNVSALQLIAENNIQINAPENLVNGLSGGTLQGTAGGNLDVNSSIDATTGFIPSNPVTFAGTGGTVSLSVGGALSVNSRIQVSSNEPPTPTQVRRSASGGNINLQSTAPTGVAINISNTGQLLSLLDAAAPGPGGKITILATGANSSITATGGTSSTGVPLDSIRADRGSVDIRHTGLNGQISLTNSNIRADIVKVGALGNNGALNIGGGTISADSVLKLYAIGTNGQVNFISNVSLSGNSAKIIAGNSVTVFNNVTVTIGGGKPADVYVLDQTKANYATFNGGNGSTTGQFIIPGGSAPISGAVTHLGMAPPAFGPPGGP